MVNGNDKVQIQGKQGGKFVRKESDRKRKKFEKKKL